MPIVLPFPQVPPCGKARFQNEIIADDFADKCRKVGFAAAVIPTWAIDWHKPDPKGWTVKWWPRS